MPVLLTEAGEVPGSSAGPDPGWEAGVIWAASEALEAQEEPTTGEQAYWIGLYPNLLADGLLSGPPGLSMDLCINLPSPAALRLWFLADFDLTH